jgi:uncharacterized membrane protein
MDHQWTGTVHIAAPVETVYQYLAELPRHCEWAQTLERMEQQRPGDARGLGARYLTYERQAFQHDRQPRESLANRPGFKGKTLAEVRELVPNRRIAWHSHPVPRMGVHADIAFELLPAPDGGTTLTQRIAMHQAPLVMLMFRPVFRMRPEEMAAKSTAQWQASLQNIKAILEEHRATAPQTATA